MASLARDACGDGQALGLVERSCPCQQRRCVETCASKARAVVAAGAERVSAAQGVREVDPALARLIDHTLLRPEATRSDILKLCEEARRFGFAAVCVNPVWVALAAEQLRGSAVKVCSVAGFPLGASMTAIKRAEAQAAIASGAQEVDMVMDIGALRSGEWETVYADIRAVAEVCHVAGALLKVILETALLSDAEKVVACALARMAGADFVKTSTGFGPSGATVRDVALMRLVVGPEMGVKAAGGIRTREDLERMVAAGATRIGASASVRILAGAA